MESENENIHGTESGSKQRVIMKNKSELKVIHANAFHTNFTEDEILLTFCVTRSEEDSEGKYIAVYPQEALGMTIQSCRQLISSLTQVLQRHEETMKTKE